jgi:hypothetical protein
MTFMVESLPQARDDPDTCASKLLSTAAWASNHSNYHAVVAYGYDTGAGGYNDTTAAGAVAAFHIMRGQHWFFGIGVRSAHMFIFFTVRNDTRIRERGIARPKNTLPPFFFLFLSTNAKRDLFFASKTHMPGFASLQTLFFKLLAFSQDSPGAKILTLVAAICARTHISMQQVHNPCNPRHYPVTGRCHSDGCGKPCNTSSNQVDPATARLLVTDYGMPLGAAERVPGKPLVLSRRYEKATIQLDCADFRGSFVLTDESEGAPFL